MNIPPPPAPLLFCETMPDENVILQWLRILRRNAYVPGSRYQVASIVMMRVENGFYFAGGVNVECYEHRLNMHAEESAIAALTTGFGKAAFIDAVWVMAAPDHLDGESQDRLAMLYGQTCGNCRQQIAGLARRPDIPVHAMTLNGAVMTIGLDILLPHSFSFADFSPEISEKIKNRNPIIAESEIATRLIRYGAQDDSDIFNWLCQLESVDYASGRGQAVILMLDNNAWVAGVKFENAAYTGQGAVQAALGIAVTVFKDAQVKGVYSLSAPGQEKNRMFYPLPLSAFQSLAEFTLEQDIPVTLFNGFGETRVERHRTHTAFSRPFLQE